MKTVSFAAVLLIAAPMAAHAQSQTAEELTRLLNGAPPAAARPAPSPAPAPAPSAAPTATAPVRPAPAPAPRPVEAAPASAGTTPAPRSSSATTAPTTAAPARAASTPAPRPASAPTTAAPARAPDAATPVVPARTPSPAPGAVPASVAPATPAPGALSAAAVAALPFRIDLPGGFQLFEGRGAPDAHVYSVRKAGRTFAMIYTGPSSQFPIYDGEQVTAAGRVSVVVPEGARRIAMEHLFQQPTAPNEIHVWLMSLSGADRDAAERIGQSVDPK